jgi:uncharacterized protein YcfL
MTMGNRFENLALAAIMSMGTVAMHGCSTAPATPRQDPISAKQYPKVVVEGQLAQWLVVDYNEVLVDHATAEKPLRVTVPVRSLSTATEMTIQYKYRWLDADGRPVGEAEWRTVKISPTWQDRFTANALTTKASDWRLEIRSGR